MGDLNEVYRAYAALELDAIYKKPDWPSLSVTPVPGDVLSFFLNGKIIDIYVSTNGKYYMMSKFCRLATPNDFIVSLNTPRNSQEWAVELDCPIYVVPQHVPCRVWARVSTFDQMLIEGYLRSGKSLPPDRVGSPIAQVDRRKFKQQERRRVYNINEMVARSK